MAYTVKAVADLAGVSVRTLHHYDHIGLLRPASVNHAGYRLYTDADLERLQQVLFFRELGFGLKEIKAILDSPGFDRKQALTAHRKILVEQQRRLERLIQSVDRTIAAMEERMPMDGKAMFEGFDQSKIEEYRQEARERWGADLVDESYRRAARYSKEDWATIHAEQDDIKRGMAALMGRDPADAEVQEQVGRQFRWINDNFYDCSAEVFRGLGDLYVNDDRFRANYEAVRPGLAEFMRAAMRVYAERMMAEQ